MGWLWPAPALARLRLGVSSGSGSGSGSDVSAPTVEWGQVGLVHVAQIVANPQGGAGWWPDPVLPTPTAFGVAGLTTTVWVRFSLPPSPCMRALTHPCALVLCR